MKRIGWICFLAALIVFSPALARAESFSHYDLDALVWNADTTIVGAELIETPTPPPHEEPLALFKVSKIYRGYLGLGAQIKVRGWNYYTKFPGRARVDPKRNLRYGSRGSLLQSGDEVILFLTRKYLSRQQVQQNLWRVESSGLFLVRDGVVSTFRQMMNPGNYVEQASEQTWADWEAQLALAHQRVAVLSRQLEAKVVVGESSPWLKLWEERVDVVREGRYFPDPISERLAQNLRASQDFPVLEIVFLTKWHGWDVEDAFKTPAGLLYLRQRLQSTTLLPEQREKLVLLEKRFAVQELQTRI